MAADQGFAPAEFMMGEMYFAGHGVAQDYHSASRWYSKAAEQGHPVAQHVLGWLYGEGRGIPQDLVRAHMWLNIVAIDGRIKDAATDRADIAKKMTPAHIARAQELASQCVAQKFKNCGK